MSWSIYTMGTKDKVKAVVQNTNLGFTNSLTGLELKEYQFAKQMILDRLDNFTFTEYVNGVKVEASGHAHSTHGELMVKVDGIKLEI